MDDFLTTVFCVAMFAVASVGGCTQQKSDTIYDCDNYGKTQIYGKWYDCKKQGGK